MRLPSGSATNAIRTPGSGDARGGIRSAAAAADVLRQHGRCDILVHSAAAFDRADLAAVELAGWRRTQAVNVEAALLLAQAFVPGMAARGFGRIIFVVSDTVWAPPRGTCWPT
jgi:NAD(P)-dependent dehydrogenase (short-subunit alcohol dehydrogenase family)